MLTFGICLSDEGNDVTNENKGPSHEEIEIGSQDIHPSKSQDIRSSKSIKHIERDNEKNKTPQYDSKEEESASDEMVTNPTDSKEKVGKEKSNLTQKRKPRDKKTKGYRILHKREKLKRNLMNH